MKNINKCSLDLIDIKWFWYDDIDIKTWNASIESTYHNIPIFFRISRYKWRNIFISSISIWIFNDLLFISQLNIPSLRSSQFINKNIANKWAFLSIIHMLTISLLKTHSNSLLATGCKMNRMIYELCHYDYLALFQLYIIIPNILWFFIAIRIFFPLGFTIILNKEAVEKKTISFSNTQSA